MKNIVFIFLVSTLILFADQSDKLLKDLEGITLIQIKGGNYKDLEGAIVRINGIDYFTNSEGETEYRADLRELNENKVIKFYVGKKGYIKYQGKFKAGQVNKLVYLQQEELNSKKIKNTPQKNEGSLLSQKSLRSNVKVVVSEKGTLYLGEKKLRVIRPGEEAIFRISEGAKVLTLYTDKGIYRKDVEIIYPKTLVDFKGNELIKLKSQLSKENKAKKALTPQRQTIENSDKVEKIDQLDKSTTEHLISEIIKPLENGSAFEIYTQYECYEMEEDKTKKNHVSWIDSEGDKWKMYKGYVENAKRNIGSNELLDDYYYIIVTSNFKLKKSYLKKVDDLFKQLSSEERKYVKINKMWNKEKVGRYVVFSSEKGIQKNKSFDKVYKLSYETVKEYSDFFKKLEEVLNQEKKLEVSLYDKKRPLTTFNLYLKSYNNQNSDEYISTNLNKDKELLSKYTSKGRYLDTMETSLLRGIYKNENTLCFLKGDSSAVNIHLIRRNDGIKISKSSYKWVN